MGKTANSFNDETLSEEIANSISHGLGMALSVAALILMTVKTMQSDSRLAVVSAVIYGISLIILYSMSTLYHSFRSVRIKSFMNLLDHSSIYLLIAGTYTPIVLLKLAGTYRLVMIMVIWILAVAGIVSEIFKKKRSRLLSSILYVAMGWIGVLAVEALYASIGFNGIMLILAGGIFYTAGVFFYLKNQISFNHAIWHIFVMAGSTAHYFAISNYVLI